LEVLGIKLGNDITGIRNNTLLQKEVYGTAYGLSKNKISNIENLMNSCNAKKIKLHECEVKNLIKEYFDV
jgi:hypothetical protein